MKLNNPFPKTKQQQPLQTQEQQLLQILQSNPQLLKKYQQQLQKQGKKMPIYQKPMTNSQYLAKINQIDKYLDEEGGLMIQPDSTYVLKFIHKRTNQKIFINIVVHQVVDHPQEKVLVDFDNQSGLRIPMSMGKVRDQTDNNGNPCKAVDVVFNPKIAKTAQQSQEILIFMAQIIANYLLQKFKIEVSQQKWKKVKGLKYKGNNVQVQRVKGKKSPKIQQVSEQPVKTEDQINRQQQLFNKLNNQTNKSSIKPQFEIFTYINNQRQPYSFDINLKSITKMEIIFDLSHLIHSKGIHLEGSSRLIYLSVRGIYQICLKIPIQIGKSIAKFGKQQRKLKIDLYPLKVQQQQNQIKNIKNKQKIDIKMDNDLLYDIV